MANDTQPSLSRTAPWGVVSNLAPRLELAGRVAGHLLAAWTVAAGLILAWVHLATGDYLAAFGQLGSSAFGETAGFLAAILPTIIRVLVAITGLAMFPMLAGFVSGPERHAFRGAFGWLSPTNRHRGICAMRFVMLHLMAFAVTIVVMASFFGPANAHVGVTFAGALVFAGGATYAWMRRRAKRKTRESRKTFWARSLPIVFYVNVALVIWLIMTADLALDIFREQLASLPPPWGSRVACGIVLMLLASYVLVSILPRLTAMILIACIAAFYVIYSDNREIAGGLLRVSRLGGGIPQAYYPPGAKVDAPPQLVCLILAIGESRIVWFPDERSARAHAPCASEGFKAHFEPKARQDTQDALKAAAGTRTLKREDFRGAPAAPGSAG